MWPQRTRAHALRCSLVHVRPCSQTRPLSFCAFCALRIASARTPLRTLQTVVQLHAPTLSGRATSRQSSYCRAVAMSCFHIVVVACPVFVLRCVVVLAYWRGFVYTYDMWTYVARPVALLLCYTAIAVWLYGIISVEIASEPLVTIHKYFNPRTEVYKLFLSRSKT